MSHQAFLNVTVFSVVPLITRIADFIHCGEKKKMQFINQENRQHNGYFAFIDICHVPSRGKNIFRHTSFVFLFDLYINTFCLRSTGRRCRAAFNGLVDGADHGTETRIVRTDNGESITTY